MWALIHEEQKRRLTGNEQPRLYQSQIILYYSDQRDPKHGQKLVHQTSRDLKTWDAPVEDVAYATYTARPGMTTVAQLPGSKYIMAYEYGGGPGFSSYSFPVYYRIAADPRAFASAPERAITAGSLAPLSSPYVVWSPEGGANGTIVVSDGTRQQLFINRAGGDPKKWEAFAVAQPVAYTRHLRVLKGDPNRLLVMGAGHLPPSTTNAVSLSVVDLKKTMRMGRTHGKA